MWFVRVLMSPLDQTSLRASVPTLLLDIWHIDNRCMLALTLQVGGVPFAEHRPYRSCAWLVRHSEATWSGRGPRTG